MQQPDRNPIPLSRVPSIDVLIAQWTREIQDGASFRSSVADAEMLSVWISGHADTLSEWCRTHFMRDFRKVSGIVSHGADLERRIGLLERFQVVLTGTAARAAASLGHLTRSEHSALHSLVRQYIAHRDCLSVIVSEVVTEQELDHTCRITMGEAINGATIAARGLAADRSGWEALHVCIERYLAAAGLIGESSSYQSFAPLSESLLRCRAVARLHEHLELQAVAFDGDDVLAEATNKVFDIRYRQVLRIIKDTPLCA